MKILQAFPHVCRIDTYIFPSEVPVPHLGDENTLDVETICERALL